MAKADRFETAAGRRYASRILAFTVPYVAINVAAIFGAFDDLRAPGSWVLALAVAAPAIGQFWAILRMIEESDEFVAAVVTKRVLLASGIAIAVATAWGFLESYADAPHLPAWLVLPAFWAAFGLVSPFVKTSR